MTRQQIEQFETAKLRDYYNQLDEQDCEESDWQPPDLEDDEKARQEYKSLFPHAKI